MIEKYCWVRGEGRLLYILAVGGGRWPVAPLPQTLEYEEPGEKRGALGKCFFLKHFFGNIYWNFFSGRISNEIIFKVYSIPYMARCLQSSNSGIWRAGKERGTLVKCFYNWKVFLLGIIFLLFGRISNEMIFNIYSILIFIIFMGWHSLNLYSCLTFLTTSSSFAAIKWQFFINWPSLPRQSVTVPNFFPVPMLFLVPNFSCTGSGSYFWYQIFSSTGIGTFFPGPILSGTGTGIIQKGAKFPGPGIPGTGMSHSDSHTVRNIV